MKSGYTFSQRVYDSLPDDAPTCHGNVHLGWWMNIGETEGAELLGRYADCYIEATSVLMSRFIAQAAYSDDEALPILYLVSHSLELALKAAHEFRRQVLVAEGNHAIKVPRRTHDLKELLKALKCACAVAPEVMWLPDDTIQFVEKIADLNVRAAFRYPFDNLGSPAWADQPIVPMAVLQHEMSVHGSEVQDLYWRLRDDWRRG